jgi:hypothetical protein
MKVKKIDFFMNRIGIPCLTQRSVGVLESWDPQPHLSRQSRKATADPPFNRSCILAPTPLCPLTGRAGSSKLAATYD